MFPSTPKLNASTLDLLAEYQKKGVGVDMVLKSVLGVVRISMLYSRTEEERKKYADVVDSIIECRMLCNFGRPSLTLRQGILCYKERSTREFWNWFFLCVSIFLRIFEQLSGDCNYLQKVLFNNWNLFKRSQLQKSVQKDSPKREHDQYELHKVNLILFRTLCDMYVYYKWIPWYKPKPVLEYLSGSTSGLIGVYLVWSDIVRAHRVKKMEEPEVSEDTPITSPVKP